MSKEKRMIEEISDWKNKHSAESIDTQALDSAMRALVENGQRIADLKAQLESAEAGKKNLGKALSDCFAATKAARKAAKKSSS